MDPHAGHALRADDDAAFAASVERHRRQLQVHCYRMVGSLEDSEDLVQETALRAWRHRGGFEGRSTLRTWLYRIATNACLDFLERRPARLLPPDVVPAHDPSAPLPAASDGPWLDPYPGRLLAGDDPQEIVAAKETIELAFLAAIQHLPPRRRAVLILRDVLGWSAKDTASALGSSVASVNSALQRARAALEPHLPTRRLEWGPSADPSADERALLGRYMAAHEEGDVDALAKLLADDVRISAPPLPLWHDGRDALLASSRRSARPGRFRYVATSANGQPAAASYVRRSGSAEYRPMGIDVLRIENGVLAEITVFMRPDLFAPFGLPAALSPSPENEGPR